MDILDLLYDSMKDRLVVDNPFCTSETENAFDQAYEVLVAPIYKKSYKKGTNASDLLCDLVNVNIRTAFRTGFYAAVNLFSKN